MLSKDPLKSASSWCCPQWNQSRITAHTPPAHPCLGESPKCSHPDPGGNFPAGKGMSGLTAVLSVPSCWEAANLPASNEILFQKDLGFSHDPGMKVWAGFRHKSRNSQNLCIAFFVTALGRRGGGFGSFLGCKSS